jgi:predicted ATP-binding protein involved in virulence
LPGRKSLGRSSRVFLAGAPEFGYLRAVMRLITKLERSGQPGGAASEHPWSELFLHGGEPWPQDATPESLWAYRGRPINVREPEQEAAGRLVASLRALASDKLDEEQVARALEEKKDTLLESPGSWIQHEGVWLRFERDDAIAKEQDAVLDKLVPHAQARLRVRKKRQLVHVEELVLTNFRAFSALSLAFSPGRSTVLVGLNGSGKSTLLGAVDVLLAQLAASFGARNARYRTLTDDDITNGRDIAKIVIKARVGSSELTWDVGRARGNRRSNERSLRVLDEEISRIQKDQRVCVPVLVHYRVTRAVTEIPLQARAPQPVFPTDAYEGALVEEGPDFRQLFLWFMDREYLEKEARIDNPDDLDHQLEAVRRAIRPFLPALGDLHVQHVPLRVLVRKGDRPLYVDQLSDGEKCLLAMVGDLARRLAIANPHADDPLDGGGVVLIDEIDLHLHPSWQRDVVPKLESTFPNCQFLLATHSPQVIADVPKKNLRLLKQVSGDIVCEQRDESFGMDSNRVLLEIMGVDERPHDVKVRIQAIFTLLGDGKLAEARDAITALEADIGADPELAKASVMIRRKEVIGR